MVRIGTSGWVYNHWQGILYPAGASPADMLRLYAGTFDTVEVNYSFYRLPSKGAIATWRATSPPDFLFAAKANRYITHMKKLLDPRAPVDTLLDTFGLLGDKLGPILFQLPPRWRVNAERLLEFARVLPGGYRYAFEFRDSTWYTDQVLGALRECRCAFCIHDHRAAPSPVEITSDWVYLRLHGARGWGGRYQDDELAHWAGHVAAWRRDGLDVYCYFNNDWEGHALANAAALRAMVTREGET